MKVSSLKIFSSLFITVLFMAGCQKDVKQINNEDKLQSNGGWTDKNDGCRLLSNSSEFGNYTYTYNNRELVDEYFVPFYGGYFKMEYNFRGQLIKSRLYTDGVLVNTVVFFYHDGHVVKESWYDGDTRTKVDEVFYTYDRRGRVSQSKDDMQQYISTYLYTPEGNVSEWNLYVSGLISYTQQFTYLPPHHKDPFLATPGLDHDFTAPNGWTTRDKWYSTSEKDISYDENGENPEVLLDQDPAKTIVHFNEHNYVTGTDFFDVLTQSYVHFIFGYENCGSTDDNKGQTTVNSVNSARLNNKIRLEQFVHSGSSNSIKEQLKTLRLQMLDKK